MVAGRPSQRLPACRRTPGGCSSLEVQGQGGLLGFQGLLGRLQVGRPLPGQGVVLEGGQGPLGQGGGKKEGEKGPTHPPLP